MMLASNIPISEGDFEEKEETLPFISRSSRDDDIVIMPCGGGIGNGSQNFTLGNDISCACSQEIRGKETDLKEFEDETNNTNCSNYWGILLSLASGLASTFTGIIVKCLQGFHPFSLATFRYQGILVPTILMVLYYKLIKRKNIFHTVWPLSDSEKRKKFGFVFIRALVGSTGLFLNFYALKLIPLADSRVIGSAQPIFVIFAAHIFLGEPMGIFPLCAAMITTVGVGIISRPPFFTGEENFDMDSLMGTLYATLSMFATTLSTIVLRHLKGVHVSVITLAYGVWGTTLSILCSYLIANHLDIPQSSNEFLLLGGLAISAFCSQTAIMKYEQAGCVIAIARTVDTIFAFVLQYLILGVIPDRFSVLGAVLIVFCVSLITFRKWVGSLPEMHVIRKYCWIVLK